MFLLYHSDRCNTSETVFHWCYVNDLHTTHAVVCWVTTVACSGEEDGDVARHVGSTCQRGKEEERVPVWGKRNWAVGRFRGWAERDAPRPFSNFIFFFSFSVFLLISS
jgi:hypothetical protein